MTSTGMAIGLQKGYKIRKRTPAPRHSNRRRAPSKRATFVRDVIREVSGYAPYERRIMELLKVGLDKRALRLAKRKVGTHKRGLKKREELSTIVAAQRLSEAKKSKEESQAS
eukprot:CAMPEP_0174260494 /NCGR_PEP_ID=MMETSP0439-20130205/9752_1 /TAXON_ID=0 /ORGANISM="Stereomyxa ramosa, Strain Chinc5" /LENGTH=111 /DNA_ID=CAMNT_0015344745 /DNA_START=26 /DNA_END=361 /DNA_ORIENTATION=+